MEVIFKEGMLFLQGVKFGKRTWRKVWIILFKPSPTGVGRLELHTLADNSPVTDQKKTGWQKTPDRKVVRLSDFLSVSPAPKESCPQGCTAFYLKTVQNTFILASTTSQDWQSALCLLAFQKDPGKSDKGGFEKGNGFTMEDNELYSSWKTEVVVPPNQYQVTVQSTEASRRCQLNGMYLVSPEKEAVSLLGINSGHIIYSWPYTLLRKFGQIEGGFSIEAGRRCESGEGVFIFLSKHGPEIFQAILKQCTKEKTPPVQQLSVHRRSLSDQSSVSLPTKTNQSPKSVQSPVDCVADIEEESENHYSTIKDTPMLKLKQLSLIKPCFYNSKESVGDEDEEERCHSLDSLNLNDVMKQNIYCNFVRPMLPLIPNEQIKLEIEDSGCIYSKVKIKNPPPNPRPPFSSPLPPPLSPSPPPCPPPQTIPLLLPKPRYQRQSPVNTGPGYNAQVQPVDDMKETEEAIGCSGYFAPTEAPGSFKHRLAEIISKDLAKFQPPLPPGAGSPTFSQ